MPLAQFIDHTLLRSTTGLADIEKICNEAIAYDFAAVCLPPYFVKDAGEILSGTVIQLATVIGFPFGYSHYEAKAAETARALEDGATELDMVMNLAAFKSNDTAWLESEIAAVTALAEKSGAAVKVIIESGVLSEAEIIRCCELYRRFPVAFLKTSTGYAEVGATVEAVKLMRQHLPDHIQVKASGGIKTYAFAKQLIDAGATRLGCSASIAIVEEEKCVL